MARPVMVTRLLAPVALGLIVCLVPSGAAVTALAQAPPAQSTSASVTPAAAGDYFAPYVAYPRYSYPEAVAIGDLNRDGLNDIAVVTSGGNDPANDLSVFVYIQDGSGGLRAPVRYPVGGTSSTPTRTIDIGDLTGDGVNDVVVGRSTHSIVVLAQNANGTLNPGVSYPTASAYMVRIGDFNGDGRKDVAGIAGSGGSVAIFTQQTTGRLALAASYPAAHQADADIDVGDMNGDGRDDLLITSGRVEGPDTSVLLQQPGGLFDTVRAYDWSPGGLPDAFALGDVNNDGRDDVAFGHAPNVAVRLQRASGGIGPATTFPTIFGVSAMEIADVDSNQRADVVVADSSSRLLVYRQQADGVLAPADDFILPGSSGGNPQSLAVGDVTGDGAADVVLVSYSYGVVVLAQARGQTVPMGVSAVGTGSTQITVTWTPVAGATNYEIYRRSAGSAFTHIGYSITSQYVNTGLAPNTAYMYRVRARLPNGATGLSDFELATTVSFTDDPIVSGTTPFRAVHLTELRRAVSAVRALAGLPALTFSTDAVPGATVRAAHIAELRTALDPALSSLALAPQPYSEPVAAGGLIKASHIEELRSRLR